MTSRRWAVPVLSFGDDVLLPPDEDQGGMLARPTNQYFSAMQNISAPELIAGFAETAPPEVQQAVRALITS